MTAKKPPPPTRAQDTVFPEWYTPLSINRWSQPFNVNLGLHPCGHPMKKNPGDKRCHNCIHIKRVPRKTKDPIIICNRPDCEGAHYDIRRKWPACSKHKPTSWYIEEHKEEQK